MMNNEAEIVHAILDKHFSRASGYNYNKIRRGISTVKYMVRVESNSYVLKVFFGGAHRRRAQTEYVMLRNLSAKGVVAVPRPTFSGRQGWWLPCSYVLMEAVRYPALDEVFDLLTVADARSLGAELGRILHTLHRETSIGRPRKRAWRAGYSEAAARLPGLHLAIRAERRGIVLPGSARKIAELGRAASRAVPERVRVHGDLTFDNILVSLGGEPAIAAIIDWEHSGVGESASDFAKLSVSGDEKVAAFVEGVSAAYFQVSGFSDTDVVAFRRRIRYCELVSDLRVAADLAREPLASLYSLSAAEHQAWRQFSRLHRRLAEVGPSGDEAAERAPVTMMQQAVHLARASSCIVRQVAALVVDHSGEVVATGINGMPARGGTCWCGASELPSERPYCPAWHAERNALSSVAAEGISSRGFTVYSTTCPCFDCARAIVKAGISTVYYMDDYRDTKGLDYLLGSDVVVRRIRPRVSLYIRWVARRGEGAS